MSKMRGWKVIQERWDSEFRTVQDALTLAAYEGVSKGTKRKIELAIKITSKHRYIIMAILASAKNEEREMHGRDFVAKGRKR